jgi:hypothetical protein
MVQTISKLQQASRFNSHVCKSQKRGWNIPSYYNRDSKAQKKDHLIYSKKHAKTSKVDLHFQLIEDIIVLYKDEKQSSQSLYK